MKVPESLASEFGRVVAVLSSRIADRGCERIGNHILGPALVEALAELPDLQLGGVLNVNEEFARLCGAEAAERVLNELAAEPHMLTEEDMRLIREHVRPKDAGDAVEAAVLKERIRCALLARQHGAEPYSVEAILGGKEPA